MKVRELQRPNAYRETDIGRVVVAWLEHRGWDVYQEVEAPAGRADIVATCGPLVGVVELKMSMGLDVLAQAARWRGYAHMAWVAIPTPRRSGSYDTQQFAVKVAEWQGFGVLHVSPGYAGAPDVREKLVAPFHRVGVRADLLRQRLRPQQKTAAPAGTSRGGHWTPFKQTCADLRALVAKREGISLKDAIGEIKTHYANISSARAHLAALIERGIVEGVVLKREGRQVRLYSR